MPTTLKLDRNIGEPFAVTREGETNLVWYRDGRGNVTVVDVDIDMAAKTQEKEPEHSADIVVIINQG